MSQFELLQILRDQYPSTTAAAHTLVRKAAELDLVRKNQVWIDYMGSNKAQVAFENAMWEVTLWAARESRETSPERLFKFIANFFAQFAMACPTWNSTLPQVTDYLLAISEKEDSILVNALRQVEGEDMIVGNLGRPEVERTLWN